MLNFFPALHLVTNTLMNEQFNNEHQNNHAAPQPDRTEDDKILALPLSDARIHLQMISAIVRRSCLDPEIKLAVIQNIIDAAIDAHPICANRAATATNAN